MIPVLLQFRFDSASGHVMAYVLAVALVLYAAFSGWRGARGVLDPQTRLSKAPTRKERLNRTALFGVIGVVLARMGLYYVLPATSFLGSRGEGFPIHTYGVFLAAGFVFAVTLCAKLAEREWRGEEGLKKRDQSLDLAFWVFLSGIFGSHVLFVIVNWQQYAGHWGEYFTSLPKLMDLLFGGLVFYGGLLGAMLASYVWSRSNHIEFLRLADIAIPTVSLGQCLGRLGCFSAGCCWGDVGPASMRFGAHFPGAGVAKDLLGHLTGTSSLAYQSQLTDPRWVLPTTGQIFHEAVPGAVRVSEWVAQHGTTLPVHPTQIYESVGQLCLLVALLVMRRYRRFHGQILGTWLMAYAVLRSTVELFRGDLERGTLHGLLTSMDATTLAAKVPAEAWYNISTSQFISLCMFVAGATLLYRRARRVAARERVPPASVAVA